MKKPDSPDPRRKKPAAADDAELWHHTARTIAPLKKAKGRVHPAAEDTPSTKPAKPNALEERSQKAVTATKKLPAAPPPTPVLAKRPPLETFDPKNARKLRSGKIDIDGRIDLHGMRQSEAHGALRRYLFLAHAKGKRWILVITGKGRSDRDESGHDVIDHRPERGILKRSVPLWLDEPDLRAIIISFTEAAIQHGGGGALYVHLRKARSA